MSHIDNIREIEKDRIKANDNDNHLISIAFIRGKKTGYHMALKEEMKWLKELYSKFPHNYVYYVYQRIEEIKEAIKECEE